MSEKHVRVLRLVLEALDVKTLRQIWEKHECLHKYFIDMFIDIRGQSLKLFSEDFCQAIFVPDWDNHIELTRSLMRRNFIAYASYVIDKLGIAEPWILADIAMANGRIAALNSVPRREEVLEEICCNDGIFYISCVSDELYKLGNRWNILFDRDPCQPKTVVYITEAAIRTKSSVMIKWIADNLDSLDSHRFYNEARSYGHRLEKALESARAWRHAPAVELVQKLINALG